MEGLLGTFAMPGIDASSLPNSILKSLLGVCVEFGSKSDALVAAKYVLFPAQ